MPPYNQRLTRTSSALRRDRPGSQHPPCWRQANNKPSIADKAANQQYLTPQEEQASVGYVLRLADNGYPLLVKFRTIACRGHLVLSISKISRRVLV
jgi:hypothetical protein